MLTRTLLITLFPFNYMYAVMVFFNLSENDNCFYALLKHNNIKTIYPNSLFSYLNTQLSKGFIHVKLQKYISQKKKVVRGFA